MILLISHSRLDPDKYSLNGEPGPPRTTLVPTEDSQDTSSGPLLLGCKVHKFPRYILTEEALLKSKVQHFVLEMLTWNAIKYSNNNLLNLSGQLIKRLAMVKKITLSLDDWRALLPSQHATCPGRPTTCFPSYGVWFQKIINSQDLILPCHNRLCFTRKGGALTYQMKVKHKTTFIYVVCPNSAQPGPGYWGACGLSLSHEFMNLKNVSNININLIKGMETSIIYKKHILDTKYKLF